MRTPEPHPLNRDFVWQQAKGPPRELTEEQVRAYGERGFFVLERAFDADTLAEVVAAIDPLEAQAEAFLQTQPDGKQFIARAGEITFFPHLVTRSPVLRAFAAHPVIQGLCRDLIGPDVRLYWDQSVYKKPGTEEEFPWHQDNGYTYVEPQQYVTCWVALTDVTVENGCPWVVPGLHRHGTLRHELTPLGFRCLEEPEGAVPAPASAGSIVVFSSLTPHRTGPNLTGDVRKAYILQYAPDGARVSLDGKRFDACDAPERQYPILVDGKPVAAPA